MIGWALVAGEGSPQFPPQPRVQRDSLRSWYIRAEEELRVQPQAAEKLALRAQEVAIELDDEQELARISFLLGKIYFFTHRDELSLQAFNHATELYLQLGDSVNAALSLNGAGNVFMQKQKNFTEALKHYQQALGLLKNDSATSVRVLVNMGTIYNRTARYPEALAMYQRVYEVAKANNDLKNMSAALNNIGSVYDHMNNYEASVGYYLKCIELKEAYQDYAGIANTLTNLGIAYSELKKYRESEQALQRSIQLSQQFGFVDTEIYANVILSELMADMQRKREALVRARTAYQLARKTGVHFHNGSVFKKLSEMHLLNGNMDSALWYQQRYAHFNDSVARQERKSAMRDIASDTVAVANATDGNWRPGPGQWRWVVYLTAGAIALGAIVAATRYLRQLK
jgi:tetratricopeptide (TPR) repeat protein